MTDQLTALLLTGEYPPMEGGVADFTHILAEALAADGVNVHVLTSLEAKAKREQRADDQATVHSVIENWGFGELYGTVRSLTKEIGADLINIQYQSAAYDLRPAINLLPRFLRQLPVITTFHDLRPPYLFPKAGRLRDWLTRDLAKRSALAIVTNDQDRAQLREQLEEAHVELIPIGSNISYSLPDDYDRATWRGQWEVGESTTLLCHFGFMNESKGGEYLVDTLDILRSTSHDVNLMMIGGKVGSSDPTNRLYLRRIQEMIKEKGLQDDIFWTGYLPDAKVSAAFTSSDICVLPYRDGASFRRGSLMAALTHGLATISTIPQLHLPELRHGENIYLVPAADAEALAEAVRKVSADQALRERLARGARELSKNFGWDRIAKRTLAAYREVVEGAARS